MKVKTYRCPSCGAKISESTTQCQYCGTQLTTEKKKTVEKSEAKDVMEKLEEFSPDDALVITDGKPIRKAHDWEILLIGLFFLIVPGIMFTVALIQCLKTNQWLSFLPFLMIPSLLMVCGFAVLVKFFHDLIKKRKNKK